MNNIKKPPSIILSLDLPIENAVNLVKDLKEVSAKIAALKVSSLQVMEVGIKGVVSELRTFTDLPIIYDHQKGCTDIPAIVERQVNASAEAGVDFLIAVPQGAGPKSLESFVDACRKKSVEPIVLLEMTHEGANEYIKEDTSKKIFEKAIELGVNYFVVPGNKVESIQMYKGWAEETGRDIKFMSPGIGAQGGSAKEAVRAGVDYPIVGRAIYQAEKPIEIVNRMYVECLEGFNGRK